MRVLLRLRSAQAGAVALAAALATAVAVLEPPAPAAAQPPKPAAAPAAALPAGLEYVPHDAAMFLYADAAHIWASELFKALRTADKTITARIEEQAAKWLGGSKLDDLKSVVLFFPLIKEPQDSEKFGAVLTFTKAFDKDKLAEGLKPLLPKNTKVTIETPANTVAVVLVGLPDYRKPAPDAEGPLTPAIKAAASGKHALVAGTTPGNLPDQLRGDELPGELRAFEPIFRAQAAYLTLDLGKAVVLDIRVKSKRAGQAVDAEKALAAFRNLVTDELSKLLPELEAEAKTDPAVKDLVTVVKAVLSALKDTKFAVEGTEARATVSLALEGLPLGPAIAAGVRKAQEAAAVTQSANNLKQIAIAFHSYHDTYGNMPPAAVCDKNGKPQLSWRVLVLPYIEQEALYKQFKLDEPWDSDHNKKLLAKMPAVYALPGAPPGTTETHYRVFVGNGAAHDWLQGGKLQQFGDGTSNTLLVVTAATAVPWTKPDELEFDPQKDMTKLLGLVVHKKAQVALADGSVRTLKKLPAKETLHAYITKNGGEAVGDFDE